MSMDAWALCGSLAFLASISGALTMLAREVRR